MIFYELINKGIIILVKLSSVLYIYIYEIGQISKSTYTDSTSA